MNVKSVVFVALFAVTVSTSSAAETVYTCTWQAGTSSHGPMLIIDARDNGSFWGLYGEFVFGENAACNTPTCRSEHKSVLLSGVVPKIPVYSYEYSADIYYGDVLIDGVSAQFSIRVDTLSGKIESKDDTPLAAGDVTEFTIEHQGCGVQEQ